MLPSPVCCRILPNRVRTFKADFNSGKWSHDRIESEQTWTRAWTFATNFLFQFEHLIRNPDDKLFLVRRCGNTSWKKVQSDPIFIFLGRVVRKLDSAIPRIVIFFKLSKIVHLLVQAWLKFIGFKQKFRFISYELDICSFIAFQAFLRRLKTSLSSG